MSDNKSADELVISYLFPPSSDVSGMVLAKRYMVLEKQFDVIQANVKDGLDKEFEKYVDRYTNEKIVIDVDCNPNFPNCIFDFVDKSMMELEKRQVYKRIYTRVWKMANNFLALEYKLKHPEVHWTAEFSDPLLYDIHNRRRDTDKGKDVKDSKYLDKINEAIKNLNKSEGTDFKLLENPTNLHVLVEYVAYLFADEVVFTNTHQRQIMLDQFPIDVKDFVMAKSVIDPQPVLGDEYYHVRDFDAGLDSSKINIGYFGNLYSKRHFEDVFYAFEVLRHKYKNRLVFHFYINNKELFMKLTENLEISDNIEIRDTIDYLDFLNLTTKFDVLVINDLLTKDSFNLNPYRPSKLSDYIGSKTDIWAILDAADVKYKSYINDFQSNIDALINILKDNSLDDDDCSLADGEVYVQKRIVGLNAFIESEEKQIDIANDKIKRLKKEIEKLEKENSQLMSENEEILSSNSRKLTKNFRKVGKLVKK